MENALTVTVSPLQVILSLAFQLWIIIFPILIIRKLNYLIDLMEINQAGKDDTSGVE